MGNINIRTDLAVELNEAVDKSDSRYSGVIVREHIDKVSLVKVTTLEIINEEGEKLFNRKAGIYITIEAEGLGENDDFYNERVIEIISGQIDALIRPCISKNNKLLVVGLGNRNVTADSLGPDVVDKLIITSFLFALIFFIIFCISYRSTQDWMSAIMRIILSFISLLSPRRSWRTTRESNAAVSPIGIQPRRASERAYSLRISVV